MLAALGAPAALVVGVVAPGGWIAAGGWLALILGLTLLDAMIGPARGDVAIDLDTPLSIGMGAESTLALRARFSHAAPARAWVAIETDERLSADPDRLALRFTGPVGEASVRLIPNRRGIARITGLWLRWPGPLGLTWKQIRQAPAREIAP